MDNEEMYTDTKQLGAFEFYNYWVSRGGFELFSVSYERNFYVEFNFLSIVIFNFEFRFCVKKRHD